MELILSLSAVLFLSVLLFFLRKQRQKEQRYLLRLGDTQHRLQQNLSRLDQLIALLLEIHEISTRSAASIKPDTLAGTILESACQLVDTNIGSLMLLDSQSNELRITAAKGMSPELMNTIRQKIGEGISGQVIQEGKPIYVEDIEEDIRFLRPSQPRYPSRSFISVPLRVANRNLGVLNVCARSLGEPFDERDVRLLLILADQAAITLENLELYENLQHFYFEMVQTLARAIDAKDSYTHGHADRARYYARRVAVKLNLPEQMIRHIEFAALMHDIGKIGIDEALLRKPGKLTEEEYEIIKQHPIIGNRIISPVTFLAPVAPMVLYHQERYDGDGYPEGLRGEEIPLGARIVALIDAFDAMCSDRPYRKALSLPAAIAELNRCKGTQFDPRVVDVFLQILKEEKNITFPPPDESPPATA